MEIPGAEVFSRELFSGVTIGEGLIVFFVVIGIVRLINRIQRARMLK